MGLLSRPVLLVLFVLGCDHTLKPAVPVDTQKTPLELARSRPLPQRVQGKFAFTLKSEPNAFAVSSNGVLILDRGASSRGHLAILGPLGGPLATLQTSEGGAAVALARQRQHFLARDAESVLRELTSGMVGVDDLWGLFLGDLPLDDAPVLVTHMLEGAQEVVLDGPGETTLTVEIATDGTPKQLLAKDAAGKPMLQAIYGPFEQHGVSPGEPGEPVGWLPTELSLVLPGLDVDLELHMKAWTVPEPLPEVFTLEAPEGFRSSPLEEAVRSWSRQFFPSASDSMDDTEGG